MLRGVRRPAAQGVQHDRRDLQRLGLLPHRLPRGRRSSESGELGSAAGSSGSSAPSSGSSGPRARRSSSSSSAVDRSPSRQASSGRSTAAPRLPVRHRAAPSASREEARCSRDSGNSSSAATSSTSRSPSSSAPRSPRSSTRSSADLINPLIGAALPGRQPRHGPRAGRCPATDAEFTFGAILGAIITFLTVAAVVYFVFVLPMNTLQGARRPRRPRGASPSTSRSTEPELLEQIRDLLAEQRGADALAAALRLGLLTSAGAGHGVRRSSSDDPGRPLRSRTAPAASSSAIGAVWRGVRSGRGRELGATGTSRSPLDALTRRRRRRSAAQSVPRRSRRSAEAVSSAVGCGASGSPSSAAIRAATASGSPNSSKRAHAGSASRGAAARRGAVAATRAG